MSKLCERVLVAVVVGGLAAAQSGRPLFRDSEVRWSGWPNVIRVADFDRDGVPDLVTAGDDVVVGFGDGVGGIRQLVHCGATGNYEQSVEVSDLDANGWDDVVASDFYSKQIFVVLAAGQGAFSPPTSVLIGSQPTACAVGDVDNDQHLDVVVACYGPDGLEVLLGDGLGHLAPTNTYPAGVGPIGLALSDVDQDGDLDAVVVNEGSPDVSLLLGDGSGGFGPPVPIAIGGNPTSVVLADFNRDGLVDIAVASWGLDSVVVRLGAGAGAFGQPRAYPVWAAPTGLMAVDFDRDGALDLFTLSAYDQHLSLLHGVGNGAFSAAAHWPIGDYAASLACADFDGDGINDVAVADRTRYVVTYAFGDGHGGLAVAPRYGGTLEPQRLATGDFDGDGAIDVAVASSFQSEITWFRGDGHGALTTASAFGAASAWTTGFGAADLDGDGDVDLSRIESCTSIVTWLNDGHGNFAATSPTPLGLPGECEGVLADLDGDGIPDWVVCTFYGSVTFFRGDGAGGFTNNGTIAVTGAVGPPRVADVDRDGDLDVLLACYQPYGITVLANDGHGGLAFSQFVSSGNLGSPYQVFAVGDLDGDGFADIVSSAYGYPMPVARWMNDGTGAFGPPSFDTTGLDLGGLAYVAQLAVADVNDDGDADVIATICDENGMLSFDYLLVLLGDGSGLTGSPHLFRAGWAARCLALCDLNADHRIDAVVGNLYSFDVSVFVNQLLPPNTSYCTAGTSTNGCVAELTANGLAHAGATSGFVLTATPLEGVRSGTIFYGVSGPANLPWAAGSSSYLCVQPPAQRMSIASSGGTLFQCDGVITQDWSAFASSHPAALGAPFVAGSNVWAQAWYRDPTAPRGSNLSNGLTFTLVP